MDAQERASVLSFLDAYNTATGSEYVLTAEPETLNRQTREVDAIASCEGLCDLAIEHTTLESHQSQRAVWQRFNKYIAPLERQLAGVFPYCFDLIVPDSALDVRKSRGAVASEIHAAFLDVAGSMPPGRLSVPLESADATIVIRKRESDLHTVYVMRQGPDGEILDLIANGMDRALDHAHSKFASYRDAGATTIALLESFDIGLINEHIVTDAVERALEAKPRPDVDQVWFAWILGQQCEVFCLYGPESVRVAANELMYSIIRGE